MNKYILLLTLIITNFDLLAHGFFEDSSWCSTNQTIAIGSVNLSSEQLATNLESGVICSIDPLEATSFPPASSHSQVLNYIWPVIFGPARDHGIMDITAEEYQVAMAFSYCACSSLNGSEGIDPSEVRPEIITGRLSGEEHHASTSGADGLAFSCHVCIEGGTPGR